MKPLYEVHRPRTFADVVGQGKAVKTIQTVLQRGWGGRAWWISGDSGTGKTTLARILAAQGADPFCITELDAQWLTPTRIRELERESRQYGMGFSGSGLTGRAYIVNESHGLNRDAVNQLLVALESIPDHVVWIFTTTEDVEHNLFADSHITAALVSRCLRVRLQERGLTPLFAARLKQIAQAEGLDGKPLETYVRLVKDNRKNFRACLQTIETGAMRE